MTWKRYLTVASFFVAFICIGLIVALAMPEQPGVTKTNFDRIQLEMTLTEVEEIFGRPPDLHDDFSSYYLWRHPSGGVMVWISEADGVYRKYWPGDEQSETVVQKIRRRLTL